MSFSPSLADSDRLRHIARHIPGVIYEFVQYPDGRMAFPYASEGLVNLYGIEPELIRDDAGPMFAAVHPDDLANLGQAVAESATHLSPWRCEHRIYHQDGRLRWVQGDATPHREADGSIRWYGYVRDVTEQKTSQLALEASEQNLRRVIGTVNGLVFMVAPDLTLTFLSPLVATVTGHSLEALLHRPFADVTHPDELAPLVEQVQACLHGESCQDLEFRVLHQDGHYYWYSANLSPFVAEAGAAIACLGIATYIDDRKRTELALQESEARYQSLVANVPGMVYRYLPDADSGTFTYVSAGCYELFGLEPEQVRQDANFLWDLIHPDDLPSLQASVAIAGERSAAWSWEGRFRTVTGQLRWLQGRSRPKLTGEELVWDGLLIDITALKQTEVSLSQEVGYRRALFEASGDGIVVLDPAGQVLEANQSFAAMLGYSLEEVAGLHVADFDVTLGPVESKRDLSELCLDRFEQRHRRRDGSTFAVEICASAVQWNGQSVHLCVCRDIEDRQRAELALQESEARFRAIFEQAAVGINRADASGRLVEVNQYFCDLLGYTRDELLNLTVQAITHPDDLHREAIARLFTGELTSTTVEKRYRHKRGEWVSTEVTLSALHDAAGRAVSDLAIVLDIRDFKQTSEALRASEVRFHAIFDQVAAGINQIDSSGRFVEVNPYYCQLLGYSKAEFLELTYSAVIHPDDLARHQAQVDRIVSGEIDYLDYEKRDRHKNGSWIWTKISISTLRNEAGQMVGNLAVVVDITDRKRAEQIIRQQAARETLLREISQRIRQSLDLPTIFNTACQEIRACLQADRVGIFQFHNDSGYDHGEFVAEACVDSLPSVLAVNIHDHCFGANYANLYVQGHYFTIDDIYSAGLADCHTDILAQFQVRASLVLPLTCGDNLWGLLCIHQCRGPRQWLQSDIDLGHQLANQLAIAIQQVTIFDQLQQELGDRQSAQQQLSDRNQELAIANQDLSRATRLKDEFLANMSHELRTPLNVILGFAQILNADPSLQAQQREYIRIMQRSGDHLLHLINDILDLSKIEANRITLEPESIDLFSLLYDLQAMFQERAEDKDLAFTLAPAPDLPQYIVADPNKLRQVLINLLGNAVKFTQVGGITLRVDLLNDQTPDPRPDPETAPEPAVTPPQAHLAFTVDDTGTGIAPDELTAIFEAFIQAKAGKVSLEGTGLGLTISRSLVHLMGGDLTVDSTPGEGSSFRFTLPLRLAEAADVAAADNLDSVIGLAPGQPSYRILVVDDQPENRHFIVAALSHLGLAVQEASNGVDAIARWQQWQPHLIWMDLRMPEIDGYEATRRIRAAAQERGDDYGPVIIALTAQASREQRDQALAAGCEDFISKPVQLNLLLTKMADHLGLRYRYADQSAQALPPKSPSSRLKASALQVMPPTWVSALYRASVMCDSSEAAQLIQRIPPEHAALIDGLNQLLRDYKFEVLMQLTQA